MTRGEAVNPVPIRNELVRSFVEHNPLYLMSALSMLAGCYALMNALAPEPGRVGRLLLLLGVLNLYELCLIGLALYLSVHRHVARDARALLVLSVVFLTDGTYLYSECLAADVRWAPALLVAVAGLATLKLALIVRGLACRYPRRFLVSVGAVLAAVLVHPLLIAAASRHGAGGDLLLFGAWWTAGGLLLLPLLACSLHSSRTPPPPHEPALRHALLLAPGLSLVAHLIAAHWIYSIAFHLANLTPLLLLAAVAVTRDDRSERGELLTWRLALPAIAVLFSVGAPAILQAPFVQAGLPVSPFRAAAVGASLVYLYDYLLHGQVLVLPPLVSLLVFAVAGRTPTAAVDTLLTIARDALSLARRMLPSTARAWGMVGVAASFVFLAMGYAVSLLKARHSGPARAR